MKKTKAVEHASVKKRKASTSSDPSAPKKMKPLTSSFANPIDVVPISTMSSKDLVPFDEEYVIPNEYDEENPTATSSEQMDGSELVLAQEEQRNLVDFLQAQLMQLP